MTARVAGGLLVVASWALAARASADSTTALAPSQHQYLVTGTTHPARVEVVMVGAGPESTEIARAVRELVGAVPELTSTEGDPASNDDASPELQVSIDVTDRTRVRIVVSPVRGATQPAGPAPTPTVREVVIADLSSDVARETVAQIVQTTVRALLDSDRERIARSLALEPSPMPSPLTTLNADASADERSVTALRRAPLARTPDGHDPIDLVVGAVVALDRHTFPFDHFDSLSRSPVFDGFELAVGLRHPALITTARLTAEWSEVSDGAVDLTTQVVMASVGVAAHHDAGRVSLALGVDAGAIVVRQKMSGDFVSGLAGTPIYYIPSGFDSNWWGGPLLAFRATIDVHLFPHSFLRLEGGLPHVWTEPKHDSGRTTWTHNQNAQLILGAGYSL